MNGIPQFFAFWAPSGAELIVIMVVALLLFGRRLPEVAKNLGKGVVEFKKGLQGIEEDVDRPPATRPTKSVTTTSAESHDERAKAPSDDAPPALP